MKTLMTWIMLTTAPAALAKTDIREVTSTSCKIIPINLGIGMTTQIVLEQEPKTTLFADKKHFKIVSNATSPRSLAIIPFVEQSELDAFRTPGGALPAPAALASALNGSFKTNLFVFFDNNNQLMFELRFVEKSKADYIVKVTQSFNENCNL